MATVLRYPDVLQPPPITKSAYRYLTFLEGVAFSAIVGLYIWRLPAVGPNAWIIFPVWLVVSFTIHRDTPKTLGWRGDNLWQAIRQGVPVLAVFFATVFLFGLFLGALHRLPAHFLQPHRFWGYFSFCLLQQVALNSYLMNRFLYALQRRWLAALLCGVVFAALHWPNPVLVPLTLVGGFAMCWVFATERNILPLTLGQAILGGLAWWAFPMAWHHSMRVGPGFYGFRPKLW
jgi:CAAX prenyl protease-like protein